MSSVNEKRKKLSRTGLLPLMVLLVLILAPAMVVAHAPDEVRAGYDTTTGTLTVTITHTRPSDGHYVNKVEIKKNGSPVNVAEYKSQTGETVTYSYKTAAVPGDTFEITAYCNKFGSKRTKITVAESPGPSKK